MYIDVSLPRPSSSPCLGILVHWLPIDSVLLTEPLHYQVLPVRNTLTKINIINLINFSLVLKFIALLVLYN